MRNATVTEAQEAIQAGAVLIDVRTQPEFASGHVPSAVFLPMVAIPMRASELDRSQPVYVICETGGRSFQVCQYLDGLGYDTVNVVGGMTQWRTLSMEMEMGA